MRNPDVPAIPFMAGCLTTAGIDTEDRALDFLHRILVYALLILRFYYEARKVEGRILTSPPVKTFAAQKSRQLAYEVPTSG